MRQARGPSWIIWRPRRSRFWAGQARSGQPGPRRDPPPSPLPSRRRQAYLELGCDGIAGPLQRGGIQPLLVGLQALLVLRLLDRLVHVPEELPAVVPSQAELLVLRSLPWGRGRRGGQPVSGGTWPGGGGQWGRASGGGAAPTRRVLEDVLQQQGVLSQALHLGDDEVLQLQAAALRAALGLLGSSRKRAGRGGALCRALPACRSPRQPGCQCCKDCIFLL